MSNSEVVRPRIGEYKQASNLHFAEIDKQVKHLKAHRAAADFDTNFIKET